MNDVLICLSCIILNTRPGFKYVKFFLINANSERQISINQLCKQQTFISQFNKLASENLLYF